MVPIFATHPVDAFMLLGAYLVWIVPEIVLSRLRRPSPAARTQDRLSSTVLLLCLWSGIFFAAVAAFMLRAFAIPWDRTLLFGIGIFLMLAGVAFRWYSIRVLGRYFTVVVAIQPGHRVVEAGPYRLLRHPSYSGAVLTLFGLGLVYGNWISLLLILVGAAAGYGYRISVEERALVGALGDQYRAYMKRTKRIIPFVI